MNEKKNTKISKFDLEIAQFVAEQGPVRISTIGRYLEVKNKGVEPRQLRRICQRLEDARLIKRKQILIGSSIAWPTASGLRVAGFTNKSNYVNSQPSMETLLHSIEVAEVRVVYEKNGAEWICERKLHSEFTNHLPDGVAIFQGDKIIVEIDRTRKSQDRLINIMKVNVSALSHDGVVDYWVPQDLYEYVCALRQLLPNGIEERVRVFVLPEVLL